MNIAVMLSGGTGKRVGAGKLKQFIEVGDRPLIINCLEINQKSPRIDAIEVICHKDWIDHVWKLTEQLESTSKMGMLRR